MIIFIYILYFYVETMIMIAYRLIKDFGEKIKQITDFENCN